MVDTDAAKPFAEKLRIPERIIPNKYYENINYLL